MSNNDIVSKLQQFITIFRVEAKKLNEDERKHITNLEDYFPNCQILIIKLGNLPQKHMIVTHDEKRPDMDFELHEIETWEVISKLEEISQYPYWEREFSDDDKSHFWGIVNYRELIEGQLIGFIQVMENSLYIKPPETFWGTRTMLYKRDFVAEFYNESAFDPKKEALKIIEGAKNQYKAELKKKNTQVEHQETQTVIESTEKLKGYGTYFYLPVWLNEYPELSFREKIRGTRASYHFDKKSMMGSYRGFPVIIEENGYIGIYESDKQNANRHLNEIMGTALMFGFPFFSVREGDMSEFSFQEDSTKIGSRQIIPRGSVLRQFDRTKTYWEPDTNPHLAIKEEGFTQLLKLAEIITNETENSDCVILFVEAFTCLQTSQFIQSFIVSWTIIEKYLYWIWDNHLRQKKVNRKRRDQLTGSDWNISRVIEMLEVNDLITEEEYKALSELRKKRNGLIHEGEVISREESQNCFTLASASLLHRTKAYEIFSQDELLKYILKKYDPYDFRY